MTQQINLPSLPEADIGDAGTFMSGVQVIALETAQDYARAAIELDRQGRGESVALTSMQRQMIRNVIHEVGQRSRCKGDYHDQVADLLTSISSAPQPAEPTIKESLTVTEPVKVMSDGGILAAFITHTKRLYTGNPKDHKDWSSFKAGFEAARPAASAEPAEDAIALLIKYRRLCVEMPRGDGYHLKRIDNAIESMTTPVAAQPSVPDGWKLVPVEPTPEMVAQLPGHCWKYNAGDRLSDIAANAYNAMLAAAPTPPTDAQAQQENPQ